MESWLAHPAWAARTCIHNSKEDCACPIAVFGELEGATIAFMRSDHADRRECG